MRKTQVARIFWRTCLRTKSVFLEETGILLLWLGLTLWVAKFKFIVITDLFLKRFFYLLPSDTGMNLRRLRNWNDVSPFPVPLARSLTSLVLYAYAFSLWSRGYLFSKSNMALACWKCASIAVWIWHDIRGTEPCWKQCAQPSCRERHP